MKHKYRRLQIFTLCFLILGILISSPFTVKEVRAYSGTHDETFIDDTFIDDMNTNVTGIGTGEISIPARDLEFVGSSDFPSTGNGETLEIVGEIAYVIHQYSLNLYNISNPVNPDWISTANLINSVGGGYTIDISDDLVYIPSSHGFEIVNVSDPLNPTSLATYSGFVATTAVIQNHVAYLAGWDDGLIILNVTDPVAATSIANYTNTVQVRDVKIIGDRAYIADEDSFQIVDLSDIYNPTQITQVSTLTLGGIDVSGNLLVCDCDSLVYGLMLYDISSPSNPVSLSNITGIYARSTIHSNRLYAAGASFKIFDISDTSNPEMIYDRVPFYQSSVYDYVQSGDYLYFVAPGPWLEVDRCKDSNGFYWDQYKPYAVIQTDTLVEVDTIVFDGNIMDVTLHVDATTPDNTSIDYYASAMNGSSPAFWIEVFPDVKMPFGAVRGERLKWKAELNTTDNTVTPTIRSINVTYTVLLNDPLEISPVPPATLDDNTPTITWGERAGAVSYNLQVDTTSDFDSSNLVNISTTSTSYTLTTALSDGDWFWRVAGVDSSGQRGEFTQAVPFTIDTGATTGTGTGTGPGIGLPDLTTMLIIVGAVVAVIVIVIVIRRR